MVETTAFIGDVTFNSFILFIFAIIFTLFLGFVAKTIVLKITRGRLPPKVYKPASKIAMYSVYFAGILFAINDIISFDVPAGLAALGVLGVALLLPTVPLLQGMAAGIVMAFERPIKEEDVIKFDGEFCKVKDIGIRKTKLRSFSGNIIIVPNIVLMYNAAIVNYSEGQFIKIAEKVKVPVVNVGAIRSIVEKICAENTNILPNTPERKTTRLTKLIEKPSLFFNSPANINSLKPQVLINGIDKDAASLIIWFWIHDIARKDNIVSSFYETLIKEMQKEKITLV